jgi:DNA-binding transcriptional MerR regulator
MIGRVPASVKPAERGSRRAGYDRRGGSNSPNQLTIEQLAQEAGMSVRNIRSHQARGLLAAPEVRLRVGYYGPDHVAQLRMIRELQDEGFNLGGIKRLLDGNNGTAERLLRFRDVLTVAVAEEVVKQGVSVQGTLAIVELIEQHCDSVLREVSHRKR